MSAEAQRRLILHMSVSLDGFVARRDGVIDWLTDGRRGVDHGDHRFFGKVHRIDSLVRPINDLAALQGHVLEPGRKAPVLGREERGEDAVPHLKGR